MRGPRQCIEDFVGRWQGHLSHRGKHAFGKTSDACIDILYQMEGIIATFTSISAAGKTPLINGKDGNMLIVAGDEKGTCAFFDTQFIQLRNQFGIVDEFWFVAHRNWEPASILRATTCENLR